MALGSRLIQIPFIGFDLAEPLAVYRLATAAAVLVPDLAEGQGLQFLLRDHELGEVARILQRLQLVHGLQQCEEQCLLQVAVAGHPGGDAVDGVIYLPLNSQYI